MSNQRCLGRRLCALFSAVLLSAAAGIAPAQQATAPTEQTPALQEVIVTGSRIPVPSNITSTSPITVVTGQDIKLSGYTDATDMMNSLPQNIVSGVDFGNQSSPLTATGGFSTVDLRGLGPQRTLVLVNGRRLGTGDPSTANPNPAPDIDQIPAPLVERIDVVTGGASATYGSDAIAGVVNFIMKKDFQGIQIDGQYGVNQHDQHSGYIDSVLSKYDPNTGFEGVTPPAGSIMDGRKHDLSVLMGTNFADGNGNVTGYFVYHDQASVPGSARDFSNCELISNGEYAVPVTNGVECLGSSNSNRFTPTGAAPGSGVEYTVVGNQFLRWPQQGSNPPAQFNFNDYEYLQREDKRYNGGFLAHDDINDFVKPFVEFSFMSDRTDEQIAPSGLFTEANPYTTDSNYLINCSNPLLSTQQRNLLCTPAQIAQDTAHPGSASADVEIGRRNVEGGGRESDYEHTNFRIVAGVDGKVGEGWKYDTYYSYYYVNAYSSNTNYLNYASIDNALQVKTNSKGQAVCISGGNCVPYDIFQTGGVNAAQLNYLYSPGTSDGNNTEAIAHADLAGDLTRYGLSSPFAHQGMGLDVGAEYRKESVTFSPDGGELSGNLAGFSGASVPTNASYDVSEAFLEVRAPLAQDRPGVEDLTVDTGYRYSNYSTAGTTNTYKFEVQYAPIQDARMRFSFDRAVRAPNLIELYNAPSIGLENVYQADPCAGVPTATYQECKNTGVSYSEWLVNPNTKVNSIPQCVAGQCTQSPEGNSQLKPEVATTWSVGLTLTPSDLRGFTASIDYFHIHLSGEIGTIPYGVIMDGCLYQDIKVYCDQIVRSLSGSITGASVANGGYVIQQDFNLGTAILSGIDLLVNDRWELPGGFGHFITTFNGSWMQHNTNSSYPGATSYDCAGLFGSTCESGSVNPRWRHNLRLSWDTPWNVLFSMQWRFIGPTSFDNNSTNQSLANIEDGAYNPYFARIPGYSYIDLSTQWHVNQHLELRAGVNNVLDKDPPVLPEADISGTAGGANSFQTYDLLGRQLFVAFTAKF